MVEGILNSASRTVRPLLLPENWSEARQAGKDYVYHLVPSISKEWHKYAYQQPNSLSSNGRCVIETAYHSGSSKEGIQGLSFLYSLLYVHALFNIL